MGGGGEAETERLILYLIVLDLLVGGGGVGHKVLLRAG